MGFGGSKYGIHCVLKRRSRVKFVIYDVFEGSAEQNKTTFRILQGGGLDWVLLFLYIILMCAFRDSSK